MRAPHFSGQVLSLRPNVSMLPPLSPRRRWRVFTALGRPSLCTSTGWWQAVLPGYR
jgi:hypothetical protein